MQHTIEKSGTIYLGKQGESRARELTLPKIAVWEAEYGPGKAEIIFLPPGKKTPVSVTPVRTEDGVWLWAVTAAETACPGYGKCELRYTAEGAVVKSATYQTYVAESLGENVSVPGADPDGKPEETQRPDCGIGQVTGLQDALDAKQNRIMAKGLLKSDGNGNVTAAMPGADYGPPALTSPEAPTSSTMGAVGQHYLNTTAGKEYTCVAADGEAGVYTWRELGGGSGNGNSSIIKIIFGAEFEGQPFTVSDGTDTVTGIVPAELIASVSAANLNSTYTITAEAGGLEHYTTVTIGMYFGQYTAILTVSHIYGVRWSGGPETALSRTDDAEDFLEPDPFVNDGVHPGWSPFDNIIPWSGMKVVDDPILGKLVSIPKYWYKWTKSGATMTLQISDKKQDGFFVSPAHADREDGKGERDVVYVGRYHCDAGYKSVSGHTPIGNIRRSDARTAISNLHPTVWQYDFAMYWTIMMLYLVEFADWDSQKTIGYGGGNGGSVQACGASDNMGYHTGTMRSIRAAYGAGCQYRWIEGLWDNCNDFLDGIYFSGANVYCTRNPGSADKIFIGTRPTTSGFIKAWNIPTANGFEWALYPSDIGGSNGAYVPDHCSNTSAGTELMVGGNYDQSQNLGIFFLNAGNALASTYVYTSCRLMKLPDNEEE